MGDPIDLDEATKNTNSWENMQRIIHNAGAIQAARAMRRQLRWMYQSFVGLHSFHRNGLMHGDVKGPNITILEGDAIHLDFEGVFMVSRNPLHMDDHDWIFTEKFAPPERFRTRGGIGFGWDIWSLMIVMLQIGALQPINKLFSSRGIDGKPRPSNELISIIIHHLGVQPNSTWIDTWGATKWSAHVRPPLGSIRSILTKTQTPTTNEDKKDQTPSLYQSTSDFIARTMEFNDVVMRIYGIEFACHLCDLIDRTLVLEHDKRLNVDEVLSHPFWNCHTFFGENIGSVKQDTWTPPLRHPTTMPPSYRVFIPLSPSLTTSEMTTLRSEWGVPEYVRDESVRMANSIWERLPRQGGSVLDRIACIFIILQQQAFEFSPDAVIETMLGIGLMSVHSQQMESIRTGVYTRIDVIHRSIAFVLYDVDLSSPQ